MSNLNYTILSSAAGEGDKLVVGAVGAAAVLVATVVYYALNSKGADGERDFPKLGGIQLYHAWNFFERRYDFLQSNFKRNLGRSFSFNVLHHTVVALTGEDARQAFYSNSQLHFDEGYKILMGAVPRVSDVVAGDTEEGNISFFNKAVAKVMSKARTQDVLPTLLQDIINRADKWGNGGEAGRIDPFVEVYNLVFVMTFRMATCRDLAGNEADLEKISELFMTLQTSVTPTSLMLPWFPGPARRAVKQANTEMYTVLSGYIEARRRAKPADDAIDVLIADGVANENIVWFIMGVLFASVSNTGIISCWALIDLATHPEWREKCKKEIQDFISRHPGDSPSATPFEKLGAIPLSAWEDELPIIEACTRESQRISFTSIALRRNVREEFKIGKQVVKRGDFLAYCVADAHLNPEYYPGPYKYDPGRWLRPDPIPNATYPYLGWGAGRHPCTGMKLGKLEMKLIMAMILTGYEFDLVDNDGKFPSTLPVRNRNDLHLARPLGGPYYFNFKKIMR